MRGLILMLRRGLECWLRCLLVLIERMLLGWGVTAVLAVGPSDRAVVASDVAGCVSASDSSSSAYV